MAQVARLVIWEGSEDWLKTEQAGSLDDGHYTWDGQVTVLTLTPAEAAELLPKILVRLEASRADRQE